MTKALQLYEKGEYGDAKEYFKKAIYEAENMTHNRHNGSKISPCKHIFFRGKLYRCYC
ncbi:MAG: hypothetical protein Q9M89_02585 [Persephonella sp.]|nr:hypothetical protein [Persephonella sp.]